MDIRKIINDNIIKTSVDQQSSMPASKNSLTVQQIKELFFIEFNLSEKEHKNREALIEIFNIKGELIKKLSYRIGGVNNNFSWDGRDKSGSKVVPGFYALSLTCGITRLKTNFTVL